MNLFLLILAFILLCALYISINIELFRKKDKEDTRRSSYQQNEEDDNDTSNNNSSSASQIHL